MLSCLGCLSGGPPNFVFARAPLTLDGRTHAAHNKYTSHAIIHPTRCTMDEPTNTRMHTNIPCTSSRRARTHTLYLTPHTHLTHTRRTHTTPHHTTPHHTMPSATRRNTTTEWQNAIHHTARHTQHSTTHCTMHHTTTTAHHATPCHATPPKPEQKLPHNTRHNTQHHHSTATHATTRQLH